MSSSKSSHGLARVLSKLGFCSRTRAAALIAAGRVTVDGHVERDPERRTDASRERIGVDGAEVRAVTRIYIALNKPRGLVVSTSDERGRDTIYALLDSTELPWLAPIGRLDKASEGLLLMSNDPEWAAVIAAPESKLEKTYHVQVTGIPDKAALEAMVSGIEVDGERLNAVRARVLRQGTKNAWIEIVLDEGRNRHLRRLLAALGYEVMRLVRVAIGQVALGGLPKGRWRHLSASELALLTEPHSGTTAH